MIEQAKRLERIEKDIRIRKRERPFREGIYGIKHPLLIFLKPRLILKFNTKGTKVKGELKWLRKRMKMRTIKYRDKHLLFSFKIDIVEFEMVVDFVDRYSFEGFLDTPIGHVKFSGFYHGHWLT